MTRLNGRRSNSSAPTSITATSSCAQAGHRLATPSSRSSCALIPTSWNISAPPAQAGKPASTTLCAKRPSCLHGAERRAVQRTALRRASTGERKASAGSQAGRSGEGTQAGGGCCTASAFPQSIVLRCRVTPLFAELCQMLLVDAINLGLHLGMPALDQDREFADQPSRTKPFE